MPASAYGEEQFLKLLKGETVTPPTELLLALAEEAQIRTVTGATVKGELSYVGYGRVKITLANEEIVAATETQAAKLLNSAAITLKPNTNTTGRSKAKEWLLIDQAGNCWVYGSLEEVVEIVKAMAEVKMPAKALAISGD